MKKLMLLVFLVIGLFGFNSINSDANSTYPAYSGSIKGVVVKAYTQPGFGRWGYEWLFMDVKGNDGKIYQIAIAPTFRIANLPIKEGDVVEVSGFTPPIFPAGVIKAVDIYDVTQKRDYPIWGGFYGPRGRWYGGRGYYR